MKRAEWRTGSRDFDWPVSDVPIGTSQRGYQLAERCSHVVPKPGTLPHAATPGADVGPWLLVWWLLAVMVVRRGAPTGGLAAAAPPPGPSLGCPQAVRGHPWSVEWG